MSSLEVSIMWFFDYSRGQQPCTPLRWVQYLHIKIAKWGLRELILRDYPHLVRLEN